LIIAGRDTTAQNGFVNPPVVRGSTVIYPTAGDLRAYTGARRRHQHVLALILEGSLPEID
jgi:cystathionine beta-lyase